MQLQCIQKYRVQRMKFKSIKDCDLVWGKKKKKVYLKNKRTVNKI